MNTHLLSMDLDTLYDLCYDELAKLIVEVCHVAICDLDSTCIDIYKQLIKMRVDIFLPRTEEEKDMLYERIKNDYDFLIQTRMLIGVFIISHNEYFNCGLPEDAYVIKS